MLLQPPSSSVPEANPTLAIPLLQRVVTPEPGNGRGALGIEVTENASAVKPAISNWVVVPAQRGPAGVAVAEIPEVGKVYTPTLTCLETEQPELTSVTVTVNVVVCVAFSLTEYVV